MAYYSKTAKGWRVQIARRGVRTSRTFATKAAAQAWATREETAILDGDSSRYPRKTVADALDRYAKEVTPTKGSEKAENLRLMQFKTLHPKLSAKVMSEVTPADIAAWRDSELKRVKPSSVKRAANSLRAVWTLARKEWGWCGESPWKSVAMPADGPPRERIVSWREARRLLRRCDYETHHPPVSGLQNVAWAFLVALRTGMRAAEIVRLEVSDIVGSVAIVRKHKNLHITQKPRRVPLTPHGLRLMSELVAFAKARNRAELFAISAASLDAQFRDARKSLLLDDLHFHDSRATALTHMARRMDVLTLGKISGHRDIRILSSTYYRESADSIAARLALPTALPRQRPKAG